MTVDLTWHPRHAVQQWKHGYIPLTPEVALRNRKGLHLVPGHGKGVTAQAKARIPKRHDRKASLSALNVVKGKNNSGYWVKHSESGMMLTTYKRKSDSQFAARAMSSHFDFNNMDQLHTIKGKQQLDKAQLKGKIAVQRKQALERGLPIHKKKLSPTVEAPKVETPKVIPKMSAPGQAERDARIRSMLPIQSLVKPMEYGQGKRTYPLNPRAIQIASDKLKEQARELNISSGKGGTSPKALQADASAMVRAAQAERRRLVTSSKSSLSSTERDRLNSVTAFLTQAELHRRALQRLVGPKGTGNYTASFSA